METLKHWSWRHGYIVLVFLTTVSKGSACEAPSSPECFRTNEVGTVYTCEWTMNNTAERSVTFDLYIDRNKFKALKTNRLEINEEELIRQRTVNIWVEAHVGNSSCTSPRRPVKLEHIVKYDAPQNISGSWSGNQLTLMWKSSSKHPALAEVRFRRDGHPPESWKTILTNTTMASSRKILTSKCPTLKEEKRGERKCGGHPAQMVGIEPRATAGLLQPPVGAPVRPTELADGPEVTSEYQSAVLNLVKRSAYQVQVRHRSTRVENPLWSTCSPVVVVPAELEHRPEVAVTTTHSKGFRTVTLSWKPMPRAAAAAAAGVSYTVTDTQSSCPCARAGISTNANRHTIDVTYAAVNISVIARNTAGCSPPAVIQLPAEPMVNLETCDKALVDTFNRTTCKQWYEHRDEASEPENLITLVSRRKTKRVEKCLARLKDYVGYLYFEHVCAGGSPRTVTTCLYYVKEGAPSKEPEDFTVPNKTHSSVSLSWKAIGSVDRRGFLTHYRLCSVKIRSQDELRDCRNISASLTKYHLDDLTPGAKYNFSLAAVTRVGAGPAATVTVSTLQEKNVNAWLSFVLLFVFFLGSTMCTIVLKRIKNRIFPPVPTPVIPDFSSNQPERQQGVLEGKEELHDELTLLQLHPEGKSVPEDAEESTALREAWDAGSDADVKAERRDSGSWGGSGDESPDSLTDQAPGRETTDQEQVEKELAMLIYRNGLVFDVKTDSA